MEPQLYVIGFLASALMGATLGVFGAGGSILTVPLLVYLFHLPARQATHSSLFVVGLVSTAGVLREWRKGALPIERVAWFGIPAMLGMLFSRSMLLPALPSQFRYAEKILFSLDGLILTVFAFFMIAAAFSMLFVRIEDRGDSVPEGSQRFWGLVPVGLAVGALSGFVGAGGGFLIVPALIFLGGLSVISATRASLFVIMLNSLWGFFSSMNSSGDAVPWTLLGFVAISALLGMILGLRIRSSIPSERLKPAFGIFVLLMGSYVLWRSL